MRAAFVQRREGVYFATIKSSSGEHILERRGKKLEFPSATAAVSAAQREIKRRNEAAKPKPIQLPSENEDQIRWRAEKAKQQQDGMAMLNLIGVQVVVKKRRFVRP